MKPSSSTVVGCSCGNPRPDSSRTLDDLAGRMWRACRDDPDSLETRGIKPLTCKTRTYRLRAFPDVLVGSEMVAWLAHPGGGALSSDAEALEVGNALLEMGYFDHVCSNHGLESKYLFYKWLCNPLTTVVLPSTAHPRPAALKPRSRPSRFRVDPGVETADAIAKLEARLAASEAEARIFRAVTPVFTIAAVVVGASPTVWWAMLLGLLGLVGLVVVFVVAPHTLPGVPSLQDLDSPSAAPTSASVALSHSIATDNGAAAAAGPPPPRLPFVTDTMCAAGLRPLTVNKVERIDSEHFEGTVLFLVRTDPLPPIMADYFLGKQRLVEMQIQGRFKTVPTGRLFMGGELIGLAKMNLNAVWRGIAWGVLRAIRALSPGELHHSFGSETEHPHISSTAFNMLEKVVVTPADQVPPQLGREIYEDPVERKARRRASKHPTPNTTDTYTFEFHTAYADLVSWRCTNLPGVGSMDLHRFWENASFALVLYDGVATDGVTNHTFADRRDFFRIQIAENTAVE
eukprot:m.49444 g.49444  ORF g.49444 m.49444 type:complete len:515 (+) comp16117_c0_seq1:159-1703(+)